MTIIGKLIKLEPYTRERCHEMYKRYKADPVMTHYEFNYDKDLIDAMYNTKVFDQTRRFFAITKDGKTIGEIQLKYINFEKRYGTLSIVLTDDSVKNKGYGTEAESLILKFAKDELSLKTVFADTVKRNERSRHVLEKLGFEYIQSDEIMDYYKMDLYKMDLYKIKEQA